MMVTEIVAELERSPEALVLAIVIAMLYLLAGTPGHVCTKLPKTPGHVCAKLPKTPGHVCAKLPLKSPGHVCNKLPATPGHVCNKLPEIQLRWHGWNPMGWNPSGCNPVGWNPIGIDRPGPPARTMTPACSILPAACLQKSSKAQGNFLPSMGPKSPILDMGEILEAGASGKNFSHKEKYFSPRAQRAILGRHPGDSPRGAFWAESASLTPQKASSDQNIPLLSDPQGKRRVPGLVDPSREILGPLRTFPHRGAPVST